MKAEDVNVADIITTISDLSLVGSGDTSDQARVLRYINLVYAELWRKTAKLYPTLLRNSQTVTITDGAGSLTDPLHAFLWVKDVNNGGKRLAASSLETIEKKRPNSCPYRPADALLHGRAHHHQNAPVQFHIHPRTGDSAHDVAGGR